jgi:hypothetical protein
MAKDTLQSPRQQWHHTHADFINALMVSLMKITKNSSGRNCFFCIYSNKCYLRMHNLSYPVM